jgi:hypothetical protein
MKFRTDLCNYMKTAIASRLNGFFTHKSTVLWRTYISLCFQMRKSGEEITQFSVVFS